MASMFDIKAENAHVKALTTTTRSEENQESSALIGSSRANVIDNMIKHPQHILMLYSYRIKIW